MFRFRFPANGATIQRGANLAVESVVEVGRLAFSIGEKRPAFRIPAGQLVRVKDGLELRNHRDPMTGKVKRALEAVIRECASLKHLLEDLCKK